MELQRFIHTALTEIVAGVAAARESVRAHDAIVGSLKLYGSVSSNKVMYDDKNRPVSFVEFDIALSESSGTDTKGGIGVYLGAVGLGSQGASHGETGTHSRIKFTVPIVFP